MSAQAIITRDGDVLDDIALRICGSVQAVHQLLQLNPGLAEYGPVLPTGVRVLLPARTAPAPQRATVRLWGQGAGAGDEGST